MWFGQWPFRSIALFIIFLFYNILTKKGDILTRFGNICIKINAFFCLKNN